MLRMSSPSPRTFSNPIDSDIVEQYRGLDVACISDVTQGLRLNCVYQGLKPLVRTWKICGPALTIRLIPIQDRQKWYKEEQHPGSLMNIAQPGDVIVIDQGGYVEKAIWGSNTSILAKELALDGIVIDGACRDNEQIIECDFPTFVKSTTCMHGHGSLRSTCYNSEPVQLGSISVAPGDLVVGDSDAIIVIPAERALEILELSKEMQDDDAQTLSKITEQAKTRQLFQRGGPTSDSMRRNWELKGLEIPPDS